MFVHYQYDEYDMVLPAMGAQIPAVFVSIDQTKYVIHTIGVRHHKICEINKLLGKTKEKDIAKKDQQREASRDFRIRNFG